MQHYQLIDYIFWIGSIIAEIAIVAIMLKRNLVRCFSFFFVSLAYDIVRGARLLP
jgi:hypothetical protein